MFTYKFIINRGVLSLRFLANNKKAVISLKYNVSPEALACAQMPKKRGESPEVSSLRTVLARYSVFLDGLQRVVPEDGRMMMGAAEVRDKFGIEFGFIEVDKSKATRGAFVAHFQKFADSKTTRGTKSVYKHTLDRMHAFDPEVDAKSFEEIDLCWLTDFENFCAKTASKNARNIHLRNIRAVFNNAIDYELTTAYPFRRFKIRPEATKKRSLSVEELREVFNYPVEEYTEIYRDMFKLIFMLIGINTVDLHGLKEVTRAGRVEYKRAKTHRDYSIKVEPEAMEIIEKYRGESGLLCVADRWSDSRNFRHQCNKALQRMGAMERKGRGGRKVIEARWPELTTYWARHSWATIAYNDLGISRDVIAQALGHSGSDTVTDIYLAKDPRLVDEANRRVLDWVLYGRR